MQTETSKQYPVEIRNAISEDEAIIYKAWLEGFKNSIWLRSFREMEVEDAQGNTHKIAQPIEKQQANAKGINSQVYYAEQRSKIGRLVGRSTVLVACAVDDPSQVYGFVVAEDCDTYLAVHYAYVKGTFRRFGICKRLLKELGFDGQKPLFYTHPTWATSEVGEKHFGAKFNPWRAE